MSVVFNAAYVVMWWVASLLNMFGKLVVESFDPYVVIQRKMAITVGYDEPGTAFLFIVRWSRSDA